MPQAENQWVLTLSIPGIGNCKGAGRVQFFHHFSKLSLSSMYLEGGNKYYVYLPAEENRKELEETDFQIHQRDNGELGTSVKLSGVLRRCCRTRAGGFT